MSIPSRLLPTTAQWIVAGLIPDAWGDYAPDWGYGYAATVTIACRIEQETGTEAADETRDALVRTATMWTNTAGVRGRDRIVADGLTWEVQGPPALVRSATGTHHLAATLRLVEG